MQQHPAAPTGNPDCKSLAKSFFPALGGLIHSCYRCRRSASVPNERLLICIQGVCQHHFTTARKRDAEQAAQEAERAHWSTAAASHADAPPGWQRLTNDSGRRYFLSDDGQCQYEVPMVRKRIPSFRSSKDPSLFSGEKVDSVRKSLPLQLMLSLLTPPLMSCVANISHLLHIAHQHLRLSPLNRLFQATI